MLDAFPWAERDALTLDERYRTRQLPLLHDRPRPPLGPRSLGPGEFWPPVRSVVVPLPKSLLEAPSVRAFLADLAASAAAPAVWFAGIQARADRMHATLAPGVSDVGGVLPDAARRPLDMVVRGPWVGRYNRGRIYLPVEPADAATTAALAALATHVGAPFRPLLAGFVQLRQDVTAAAYDGLRSLVAHHRERLVVPLRVDEVHLTETMDDLVLRSRVVERIALG
ncbi:MULTISPECIES: hypothetical protein [unclassified Nocardioides]|jgi:hypothetical protein|uniref:hypothetical protein n=1 Tax=unclassified Nocardioides TaxID=2615069 RepID=UPI0011540181|nr:MULTISPECIES: hypothetical protein [unclassified Nocardioides]TQK68579.1 hypothetical protein FBY23_0332 [Nocardioides sp. SLBN-35]WGY02125.1 hypothetical protein QI633_26780 [Nocardioides sp. QY071]